MLKMEITKSVKCKRVSGSDRSLTVQFHLVGRWYHGRFLEQPLELGLAEVGDADGLCLARLVAFL